MEGAADLGLSMSVMATGQLFWPFSLAVDSQVSSASTANNNKLGLVKSTSSCEIADVHQHSATIDHL